jgi:hypothetical protein
VDVVRLWSEVLEGGKHLVRLLMGLGGTWAIFEHGGHGIILMFTSTCLVNLFDLPSYHGPSTTRLAQPKSSAARYPTPLSLLQPSTQQCSNLTIHATSPGDAIFLLLLSKNTEIRTVYKRSMYK